MVWFWIPLSEEAWFHPKFVTSRITQYRTPLYDIIGGSLRTRLRSDLHVTSQNLFLVGLVLRALLSCYARRSTVLCACSRDTSWNCREKQSLVHGYIKNNVVTQETPEWAHMTGWSDWGESWLTDIWEYRAKPTKCHFAWLQLYESEISTAVYVVWWNISFNDYHILFQKWLTMQMPPL